MPLPPDLQVGFSGAEAARQVAVTRFIEKMLVPLVNRVGTVLTAEELVQIVETFKRGFSSSELLAVGRFELVPAVELWLLDEVSRGKIEYAQPLQVVKKLIDEDADLLSH